MGAPQGVLAHTWKPKPNFAQMYRTLCSSLFIISILERLFYNCSWFLSHVWAMSKNSSPNSNKTDLLQLYVGLVLNPLCRPPRVPITPITFVNSTFTFCCYVAIILIVKDCKYLSANIISTSASAWSESHKYTNVPNHELVGFLSV